MFPRVLVATDFSAHADYTLRCIGQIPGMEEILLVHVINGTPAGTGIFQNHQPSPREQAQSILEEKRQYLEQTTSVRVRQKILEAKDGDIAGAVIRSAYAENISLIVMGGRGKGLLAGYILGSVSEGVIQRSNTDVLIVHLRVTKNPDEAGPDKFCRNVFSEVLCPVDFSRPSEKTLEYAGGLGCIRHLTLLHVVNGKVSGPDHSQRIDECRQKLALIEAGLAHQGIRTTSMIRSGSPAREIIRIAGELDVSLIMFARLGLSDYIKNVTIGSVAAGIAMHADRPLFLVNPPISLNVLEKELEKREFPLAEELWLGYHQQKADPSLDRVFGVFAENTLVAAARCRRHPDGLEVDAVYTPEVYRGKGYARRVVQELVDTCGNEPLYMHAKLDLTGFYQTFGFAEIPEQELPAGIRDRFNFADGDLRGADVSPMKRVPLP
jgi:nucleotide-binding universal stress UspA family protein/GNAT superfamily N-acetyltransferase